MRNVTTLFVMLFLLAGTGMAQTVEYSFTAPPTSPEDITAPYTTDLHSGVRSVTGPYDTDQDGNVELLLTDYSRGGRVHVIEHTSGDAWELVWSSPFTDSTGTSNARYAVGDADLDGDGNLEIVYYAGGFYSDTNPKVVDGTYAPGLWVWENNGDDSYGDDPAFICQFNNADLGDDAIGRFTAEFLAVDDIDDDGVDEIIAPHNGASAVDFFYIYSVSGTFSPGEGANSFASCVSEYSLARIERDGFDFTYGVLGSGSPYVGIPADLDGDGSSEVSFHTWNNFNFFNLDVTGTDAYAAPDTSEADAFLKAAPGDHVALFGAVAVDINGDGDDEVYYPRFQSFSGGEVSVLNYEAGEDVLKVTPDNLKLDLIKGLTNFGIDAGDVDGDGDPDLIGAGANYTDDDQNAGNPSNWIHVATYKGGGDLDDPERGGNYLVEAYDTSSPMDTTHFNYVFQDSAGTLTEFYEHPKNSTGDDIQKFATKVVYLGDVDDDQTYEIAVAFQSVADSNYVIDRVWNADSSRYEDTIREAKPANREFMRIVSVNATSVSVEDNRIVMPTDYELFANYPNPFNPTTTIGFKLPIDKRISVKVYDISGRVVATLVNNEFYSQGKYEVTWNGRNSAGMQVASGTYFYSLEYGNFRQTKSMVLLK